MDIIFIIYMICFFCIGTLFGSFFSLAIYRIPKKEDIMIKRSYCPNCKHELGFFDLIPVLSYIFKLGKCKYCKENINIRYFAIEIISGLIFLITYVIFGHSINTYIILSIYVILFIIIGSFIMKKKMNIKENQIKQIKNVNNKKGVFNVELIVAMFAFAIYFTAATYMSRNYRETLFLSTMRSLAFNVASNKLEETKNLTYNNIVDKDALVEIQDGYSFSSQIEVVEYVYDEKVEGKKYTKKIISKVTYKYGEKNYEIILKDIKNKRGAIWLKIKKE